MSDGQSFEALVKERDELRKELERLQPLVELASDWLWEVDERGLYTYVSPRIREFLGYEPEEALGKSPFEFMDPAEAARVGALFGPLVAARQPFRDLENLNRHKGGGLVYLETSGSPIFDASGAFVGYRGIDRDVTAARRAELEHARLKDEIIRAQEAALAELSTPIIPLSNRVMVMPLIGAIDQRRNDQIMQSLLTAVTERRASIAIIDITGVAHVDSHVASGLVLTARAMRLVGARVVLTGLRPDVARVLVNLGVDLEGLVTRRTLQDGIAYAEDLA